jgi:phosphoserine phosphatase RsbU/P
MADFKKWITWLWIPWLVMAFGAITLQLSQSSYYLQRVLEPETLMGRVPLSGIPPKLSLRAPPEVKDRLQKAGLDEGDAFLSVNGEPLSSYQDVRRLLHSGPPDREVALVVERKNQRLSRTLKLVTVTPFDLADSLVFTALWMVLPSIFIAVGLFVSAVRIRDPRAWAVGIMLVGFASFFQTNNHVRESLTVVGFQGFYAGLWLLGMVAFIWVFPERYRAPKALTMVTCFLCGLVFCFTCAETVSKLLYETDFARAEALYNWLDSSSFIVTVIFFVPVFIFFYVLQYRFRWLNTNRDSIRRLKLINLGAQISFTPLLFSLIATQFLQLEVPRWVFLVVYSLLGIFPLTLAYVVIVDRALDLKVVVRSGVRYALARGTVILLAVLAVVALVQLYSRAEQNFMSGPGKAATLIGFLALVGVVVKGRQSATQWVDRRFFREAYDREKVLTDLSEDVRQIPDRSLLFNTLTTRLSESLHVKNIGVLVRNGDHLRLEHFHGPESPTADALSVKAAAVQELAKSKSPVRIYFDDPESWVNCDNEVTSEEKLILSNLSTQLLVPVLGRNELLGAISLGPKLSEEPYSPNDVRLLSSIANQTGLALENVALTEAVANAAASRERINRELEIAREVQTRLLPNKEVSFDGLDYSGYCRPARGVGGDYYDFIRLNDGMMGVAIGDVSGKGVGAALTMASLQASLRAHTMDVPDNLSRVIGNMNRLLFESSAPNRYATFFYGQYDRPQCIFTYVNAGHNAPMLVRQGKVIRLDVGGPVIGLLQRAQYQQGRIQVETGDLLVAFTDGISEAMNLSESEWGEEALESVICDYQSSPCQDLIHRIVETVDQFTAGAPQHDDMTLLVVRF